MLYAFHNTFKINCTFMNSALIIFMKGPKVGQVKTRLAASIGDEKALELYKILVESTVKTVREVSDVFDPLFFIDREEYVHETAQWLSLDIDLFYIQKGVDLGEKMANAFDFVLHEKRYKSAVIIGTDIHDLSSSVMIRALKLLSNADLVIGPALDGGYYLLGMKKLYRDLFNGIAWSTSEVCEKTIVKGEQLDLKIELLEVKRDIDTWEDLQDAGIGNYSGI